MNGKFKKSVTCSNGSCARLAEVDFTEEIVKMVVLTGLVDDDVKREVLANETLENMTLEQTISTVELREQALRSLSSNIPPAKAAGADHASSIGKSDPRLKKEGKCDKCSKIFKCFILTRAQKVMEVKSCRDCHRKSQQARRDSRNNKSKDNQTSNSEESALMWDMMGLNHDVGSACSAEPSKASSISTIAGSSVAVLNMIFDGTKGW